MNQKEIELRLAILLTALQYSSEKTAMLSTGERILINQERAHWMQQLDDPSTAKNFEQKQTINKKITGIIDLINNTGWEPKPTEY